MFMVSSIWYASRIEWICFNEPQNTKKWEEIYLLYYSLHPQLLDIAVHQITLWFFLSKDYSLSFHFQEQVGFCGMTHIEVWAKKSVLS
jgi:hypothetical protein